MRPLCLVAVLLAAAVAAACGGPPIAAGRSPAGRRPRADYYLALGDSLARGVQADPAGRSVDTGRGYADQLAATLRRGDPGLRLVKLGCPGETTTTMISGRHCHYPAGSQLAAAVRFLRAHRGEVSLITIDIGANDPGSCFTSPVAARFPPCRAGPRVSTAVNLARILGSIRAAAGAEVRIAGMSYYAPGLALWRDGRAGRRDARLSDEASQAFNAILTRAYASSGARVADVAGAFHTADFTGRVSAAGSGRLPRNVAAICAWTWTCTAPPRGPNEHPNSAGYAVIARAFLAADQR